MAKVGLTKLGLNKNTEVKQVTWNDQIIEVKQYLPVEESLELASDIINLTVDDNGFYNPGKVDVYTTLCIIERYTNINITEKQREDPCKLYDLFMNGFSDLIFDNIPESEIEYINKIVEATIKNIYDYRNSFMGILERTSKDYGDLELDANNIREQIGNKENVEFLKDVLDKLG